jgi:CubicO group peptidase (beta-lactamase class C family)
MMNRRSFLLAATATATVFAAPARAQDTTLHLNAAADYARPRRGVSLLVMHRGEIIFEDYPNGGAADRGWELASGTKSFTGVMAAAAVQDRLLALDEPASETLREWRADPIKRRITIHQLLSLESGLNAGAIGRPPTYADAINAEAQYEPATHFEYGPVPFQIFGEIMRRKTNGDPLAYLTRRVFEPLHIAPTSPRATGPRSAIGCAKAGVVSWTNTRSPNASSPATRTPATACHGGSCAPASFRPAAAPALKSTPP